MPIESNKICRVATSDISFIVFSMTVMGQESV
jgi:hypothetical protein